jgi:TetR/AcrR family transcriptional regulator, copper-responsive repressor
MKNIHATRPRGRPRAFDRDQALEKAKALFWAKGYAGVSISDLSRDLGINPPSLYAAFGDKRTLFEEAVGRYLSGEGGFAARALEAPGPARTAVERMLMEAARNFTQAGRPTGCMAVMAATNCADEDRGVCDFLTGIRAASTKAIRRRIADAGTRGELAIKTDADALASFYASVFQGMSIKARDGASRKELKAVAALAMMAWPSVR